jgi:lipoprotein NlpI
LLIGNTQLAERFFSQASLAAPDMPEAHYYLGLLYFNLLDYSASQTHLLTAIDLAEQSGDAALQAQAERLLDRITP